MFQKVKKIVLMFSIILVSACILNANEKSSKDILVEYGWTPQSYYKASARISKSFKHKAGEYPDSIYWAYCNELCLQSGFNLEKYKGKKVDIHMFSLKEFLPDALRPFTAATGMVVTYKEKIIGAWIAGLNGACSLDKTAINLIDINKRKWEHWLLFRKIVKEKDKKDKVLKNLESKEVVEFLIESINNNDYKNAFACFSRRYLLNTMLYNITKDKIFKNSFSRIFIGEIDKIEAVSIKEIKSMPAPKKGMHLYNVTLVEKHLNVPAMQREWKLLLFEELPGFGWRIADIRR